jgi:hypothetical protein
MGRCRVCRTTVLFLESECGCRRLRGTDSVESTDWWYASVVVQVPVNPVVPHCDTVQFLAGQSVCPSFYTSTGAIDRPRRPQCCPAQTCITWFTSTSVWAVKSVPDHQTVQLDFLAVDKGFPRCSVLAVQGHAASTISLTSNTGNQSSPSY